VRLALVATLGALLVTAAGCGGDGDGESETRPQAAAQTAPADPNQAMVDCLEGVAYYTVERQGPREYQVTSAAGSVIANIDVFDSAKEAQGFASQLTVHHVSGKTGVAAFTPAINEPDTVVIAECLP
jgi:hypothetical protein